MRLLRRALVPLAVLLLTGGCHFIRAPGPRSLTRAEVDAQLPNMTVQNVRAWRKSILEDPESDKFIHRKDTYGYRIYGRHGPPVVPMLAGAFKLERHMGPGFASGKREIIEQKDWLGVLSPALYTDYRIAYFDVDSGRAIFASNLTAITPILQWGTTVGPAATWNEVPPAATNGGVTVDAIRYEEERAVYIAGGALAFGTHNRAPFLQILWIQFPLGGGLD